ncbi:hypothetical protein [Vibrio parahaemolyticus]|uniref:Uncharacterized protein n=1 Tax=Vibrio phage vB_ValM-yong1 TaxID=2660715 RepID=A0A6M3A3H1_9CAUD|nr:hypothetical protein [Vibrio parahaemolyticus]YP_009885068.1 hypothetical protein HYQ07_gp36 [Vibrio phage Valm-yong1]HCZ9306321.1 hypothetical protein [Vibrio alginolyticus]MBM5118039.1 hypothetical protein [Vibrio parahaemolyticus]MBM5121417.1 hypothetical protein [Vibrio parahaemolyticus]MBM5131830.1 hypothetical protein [Vibrio parahaemolyticus]MBM5138585.1 hypothetical protein [Vibrio parahaemolyticus]
MNFLTGIVGKTLLEVLKGLFFQIGWKIILERFATRTVVWGLETLKGLTTNDVMQETVDDIINALQGKRLKEIPQKE